MGDRTQEANRWQDWVFPVHPQLFPLRAYQRDIAEKALFANTLVCLPTGLGKTFIAAVVMLNYHRWFPTGKILFLAPTRPLVNQQKENCMRYMAMIEDDVVSIEGTVASEKRTALWRDKRLIFATPQTLRNDLRDLRVAPQSIVCVVVDEAHKATGDYAYATVIQEIADVSTNFRVLALSATPGTDLRKIQMVINNLRIAHIEARTEDDPEIAPFVHQRQIEFVKCEAGGNSADRSLREELHKALFEPWQRLHKAEILHCSPEHIVHLFAKDAEAEVDRRVESGMYSLAQAKPFRDDIALIQVLTESKSKLHNGGIRALYQFLFEESLESEKYAYRLQQFLDAVQRANRTSLSNGKNVGKVSKLKEILLEHFSTAVATRAIVFVHLRTTVAEIKATLESLPGLRPREFVGQSASHGGRQGNRTSGKPGHSSATSNGAIDGLSQAEQREILRDFNAGKYNVLIATSIAEEGLDIAEVDLIVLFDAVSSPTRFVQRCGRTGRQRAGRIVSLVTSQSQATPDAAATKEKKTTWNPISEEEKLQQSHQSAKSLSRLLKNATQLVRFPAQSPAMLPADLPRPTMKIMDVTQISPSTKQRTNAVPSQAKGSKASMDISQYLLRSAEKPATATEQQSFGRRLASGHNKENEQFDFYCLDADEDLLSVAPGGNQRDVDEDEIDYWDFSAGNDVAISGSTRSATQARFDVASNQGRSSIKATPSPISLLSPTKPTTSSFAKRPSAYAAVDTSFIYALDDGDDDVWFADEKGSRQDNQRRGEAMTTIPTYVSASALLQRMSQRLYSATTRLPFLSLPPHNQARQDPNAADESPAPIVHAGPPTVSTAVKEDVPSDAQAAEQTTLPRQCEVCLEYADDRQELSRRRRGAHAALADSGSSSGSDEDAEEVADDAIVVCHGGCGGAAHRSCYGVETGSAQPECPAPPFTCERCAAGHDVLLTCALCFQSGGLMKKSVCGQFVHPMCALFTEELGLDADLRPAALRQLVPRRQHLLCRLCRCRGGACVQCGFGDCLVAYHPFCAWRQRLQMVIYQKRHVVSHKLYCPQHAQQVPRTAQILSCHQRLATPRRRDSLTQLVDSGAFGDELPRRKKRRSVDPLLRMPTATPLKRLKRGNASAAKEQQRELNKARQEYATRFLETEAGVSGSASDDDDEDEEDEDISPALSGDFINDGPLYTQATPTMATQVGVYLHADRVFAEQRSPDDAGDVDIAALVRRRQRSARRRRAPAEEASEESSGDSDEEAKATQREARLTGYWSDDSRDPRGASASDAAAKDDRRAAEIIVIDDDDDDEDDDMVAATRRGGRKTARFSALSSP